MWSMAWVECAVGSAERGIGLIFESNKCGTSLYFCRGFHLILNFVWTGFACVLLGAQI